MQTVQTSTASHGIDPGCQTVDRELENEPTDSVRGEKKEGEKESVCDID